MDFKRLCKDCDPSVHCCIFKHDSGFVFVGIDCAKEIKKKTGKDYDYFLDYSSLPKKVVTRLKDDDPALEGTLRLSQLDGKNRLLRLKTKHDCRCIFLDDSGLCEIYSIRPNICKIFPYWAIRLKNRQLRVISHDIGPRCKIIKSRLKKHDDVEESLSKKEIAAITEVFQSIEKEDAVYKKSTRIRI